MLRLNSFCGPCLGEKNSLKNIFYEQTKPSNLNKLLENSYSEIFLLLKNLDELEHKIFGSAIRIKHSVFRNSWLLSGKNQLNNSSLSSNLFSNNLQKRIKNFS